MRGRVLVALLAVVAAVLAVAVGRVAMSAPSPSDHERDRAEIYAHIDRIFRAYQARDFDEIRKTHTTDWRGFQIPSRAIVHGISAYMETARKVADSVSKLEHWEFLEREVEFHQDLALVWYVARETIVDPEGKRTTVLLRSIDLYRRDPEGWNQCGSHIVALPDALPDAP